MATDKQIEANRLNAQKSSGPRTTNGKSASRLNALKHGLFATDPVIPGEDPARFQTLRDSYQERFQPATPEEHTLLAAIVRNAWYLERYTNIETDMWTSEIENNFKHYPQLKRPYVMAEYELVKLLGQMQQRLNAAERHFRRDLELLIKLQNARQKAETQPKPAPEPNPNQPLTSEIGFVPQLSPQPPIAASAEAPAHSRFGEPGPRPPAPAFRPPAESC